MGCGCPEARRSRGEESLHARRAVVLPPAPGTLYAATFYNNAETRKERTMAKVEKSIDVNVPVRTAYNQWTQFEQFPRFMEGVKEVRQLDDQRLHWRAEIAGKEKEWDAEIFEQVPDRKV